MARQDYLKRQIESLTRIYENLFRRRDRSRALDEQLPAGENGELPHQQESSLQDDLEEMIACGQIGQAEDLLFALLEDAVAQKVGRRECEELVTWFYEELGRLSDKELEDGDFSRDEIMQGQAQALYLCIQAEY